MPKELEDCVSALIKEGYTKEQAYAICTAQQEKKKNRPKTLDGK